MEQTNVVAPSAAETTDVFNGQEPSLNEYNKYRETGEVPERFKPSSEQAESETAKEDETQDPSEGDEPENESDSETDDQQQEKQSKPKKQTAEERIAQLESTIEKIKRGAGLERKTEVATVTEPNKDAPPQNYQEWRKAFKPSQWVDEFAKANPEASYEDATAAMADYLGDVRDQYRAVEERNTAQQREMSTKVAAAKERYGDTFEQVLRPTVESIISDNGIPGVIKEMLNDSDVSPDLIFTLGSDPDEFAQFVKLAKEAPGKAIRYLAAVEAGIQEELKGSAKETARDENGQFKAKEEPPAKTKTSAPKPPSTVTGKSSGAFDVSDESLSADEWMRKRNEAVKQRG